MRWLLIVLLAGCGGAGARAPLAPAGAEEPPPADAPSLPGPLAERYASLASALEAAGLRPEGPAETVFLPPGESHVTPLELPSGCLSVVAWGSAGIRDLDAALYAPDGRLLAEDVARDPHPALTACSEAPRRAWLQLTAYAGAGEVGWRRFGGPEAAHEAIAEALGGQPGRAGPDPGLDAELRALIRRGFTATHARILDLPGDAPLRFPLPLAAGECAAVVVRGAPVALHVEVGGERRVDAPEGERAAVQLCVPVETDAQVVVRSARPARVRALVARGRESRIGGEAGLWEGRRMAPSSPSADAALDAALEGRRPRARGRVALRRNEARRLRLPGRGCRAVLLAPGRGLQAAARNFGEEEAS